MPADAVRGRKLLANRPKSLCLLCHSGPVPEVAFQGNLAPDLSGVGSRYTAAQLRQRMVDPRAINPESIMPAYYDITGLTRVSDAWRDQPILSAQEIEDIIAFMVTLR
jgi:sulfur-oxidizing protein SoxX